MRPSPLKHILLPVGAVQIQGDENGHDFRKGHGQPDAGGDADDPGKDQDKRHHQDQGPQRGDQRRDRAVPQCGKIAGEEHVPADEQKHGAEQLERLPGQVKYMAVLHKQMDDRLPQQQRDGRNEDGADADGQEAVTGGLPDLFMVPGAHIVADDGGGGHGDAHIKGDKEIVDIHNDGDSRHPVLAEVLEHDHVKEEGGNAGGHLRQHLAAAVGAGLKQHPPVCPWPAEADMAELQEIHQPDEHTYGDGQKRSPCGAEGAHIQYGHKNIVENDVADQPRHRHRHAHAGLAVGTHHVFKKQLEGHGDAAQKDDKGIGQHMGKQSVAAAQQYADGLQKDDAEHRKEQRKPQQHQRDKGKDLAGLTALFLPHFLPDDRPGAGGQHDRGTEDDAGNGDDDIDAPQRIGAGIFGYKKTVDGGVKGQKDHGEHRWHQIL